MTKVIKFEQRKPLNKHFARKIGAGAAAALASSSAFAEIPAAATTALTGFITDATDFIAAFWPLAIAVVVGFAFFSLFKKGVSKAT